MTHLLRVTMIVLGLTVFAIQAGSAGNLGSIKMTVNDSDQMTVSVQIDDREGPAIVDTAATYAMVDADLLSATNSVTLDQEVAILGLSGRRLFPVARIGPVSTGDVSLAILPAAINTQARFPGHKTILPASAFKARVIDFDFNRNRIDLYDTRPQSPGDAVLSRISYSEIEGLPFIQVKLNGKTGLALIDTGSDATYINSKFAEIAGARLQPDKTVRLFGSDANSTQVRVMSARSLKIGRHSMRDFRILSADPPLFEHLGLAEQPVMVLGLDTLRNFRLQIDRDRKHVLLSRPESRAVGRRFRVQPFSSRIRPGARR